MPDIYYLSVNGISVSFYMGRDSIPLFIEKTDVRVVPVFTGPTITAFEVTDVNGVLYVFDEVEQTRTFTSGGSPVTDNSYYTTAWYLKRIVSPHGIDLLTFSYTSKDSYFSQYDIIAPYRFIPFSGVPFQENTTMTTTFYTRKPLLNTISFPLGEVLFTRDVNYRLDLNGDKALQSLTVRNVSGDTIQRNVFFHTYFGPPGGDAGELRLRLDSLSQYGGSGRKLNYAFEYDTTHQLPNRLPVGLYTRIYHEDHWGYYNGVSNSSYEAKNRVKYYFQEFIMQPIQSYLAEFGTANREPNAAYASSGMLTAVTLPTGGRMEFDYEGHTSKDERLPNTVTRDNTNIGYDEQPHPFTITTLREPYLEATFFTMGAAGFEVAISIFRDSDPISPLYIDTIRNQLTNYTYKLETGDYFVKAKQIGFPSDTSALNVLTLRKETETLLSQKPVGGLRIRQSRLIDTLNNVTLKRDYFYTEDGTRDSSSNSTGTIANPPQYGIQNITIFSDDYVPDYFSVAYLVPQNYTRQLFSTYPLNPTQGSQVGYHKTWTLDNDSLKTECTFTSYDEFLEMADSYRVFPLSDDAKVTIDGKKYETHPIAAPDERDFLRGRPLSITQYKLGSSGFEKVLKTENTYEYNMSLPTIRKNGMIDYHLPDTVEYLDAMLFERYPNQVDPMADDYIAFKRNRIYTGRYDLKSSTTTVYEGSDSIRTQTTYIYGDSPWVLTSNFHYQPTQITTTTSRGDSLVDKLYYPYNGYLSLPQWDGHDLSTFAALTTQNWIDEPVLTLSYRNGSQYAGNKRRYDVFTTREGMILDLSHLMQLNTATQGFDTLVHINERNEYGYILEVSERLGPPTSYLYSYGSQYPVAQIQNASYATIKSVLGGQAAINNFADLSAPNKAAVDAFLSSLKTDLPDAHISSSVYQSLLGLISSTDAKGESLYFEYDDFGRLALIKNRDGDIVKTYCYTYAGQLTDCDFDSEVTYYNVAVSGSFTRNNCPTGATGGTVTYTIPAGTYSSTVSQAAADALAQAAVNSGGQAYANTNGVCTYWNTAQSGNFTRNNCTTGGTGSTVTYTIAANTYSSTVSQAAANALAQAAVSSGGQAYANTNGICTYWNTAQSGYFTRNNCGTGGTGSTVLYTISAGSYSSTESQAAANALAQSALSAGGQAYANSNGTCTYWNTAQSGNFTRNNCGTGGTGSTVTYTIGAGNYSSTVSQSAANALAQSAVSSGGQAYANSNGTCTYWNTEQSRSFMRNNCPPNHSTSPVNYIVPAGTYSSAISLDDANAQANDDIDNNGQAYANTYGTCTMVYWNVAKSQAFVRNNCPSGYNGTSVTYSVPANTYSSIISQVDADQKAQNDINTNGQAYANTNGSCVLNSITISYVNQTKLSGGVPSGEIYQASFYTSGGGPSYIFNTTQLKAGVNIPPGVYDVAFSITGGLYDPMTQYGWGSVLFGGHYVNYSDYPPSTYYLYGVNLAGNSTIYLQRLEMQ